LLADTVALPKLVDMLMPNEMVMDPPKAVLPSPSLIATDPPLVLLSPGARVKLLLLLVDDDPETIDPSPPAALDKSPAVTLNAPPMLAPEPTEIAKLPPKLNADEPFLISKVSLLPTLAILALNNRLSNTPAVPELLVDMAKPSEPVAVPTPDEMVMEPPKAVLPFLPSIVTVPPLVLPSPKARVELPLLLVDDNPETIDASPPAALLLPGRTTRVLFPIPKNWVRSSGKRRDSMLPLSSLVYVVVLLRPSFSFFFFFSSFFSPPSYGIPHQIPCWHLYFAAAAQRCASRPIRASVLLTPASFFPWPSSHCPIAPAARCCHMPPPRNWVDA
jgi:hypothetical protein